MTACFKNYVRMKTTRHFSYTLKVGGFPREIPLFVLQNSGTWFLFLSITWKLALIAKNKKIKTLFLALNKSNTKAKIFYLADLFKHVNQLNKTLQGQNTNLLDCAEKVRSFLNKLSLWKMHLQKNEFAFFCNLAKTAPSLEVIASCTNHLQKLREDMTRRSK